MKKMKKYGKKIYMGLMTTLASLVIFAAASSAVECYSTYDSEVSYYGVHHLHSDNVETSHIESVELSELTGGVHTLTEHHDKDTSSKHYIINIYLNNIFNISTDDHHETTEHHLPLNNHDHPETIILHPASSKIQNLVNKILNICQPLKQIFDVIAGVA
jgi:hypothetical protein